MRDSILKALIQDGHMTGYIIKPILPKLLIMKIFLDNHKPVYLRRSKWEDYWDILDEAEAGKV